MATSQLRKTIPTASDGQTVRFETRSSQAADKLSSSADTTAEPSADAGQPAARAPELAATKAVEAAPKSRKRLVLSGAALVAILAAGWYGYDYWTVGQYMISTDDAYVGADMAMISPKISANVADVPIVENQHVKAGDVLIKLDAGDYQLAVDQAAAKLATQIAALDTYDAQITAAIATAAQTRAQLDSAKATLVKNEADFERTNTLAQRDYSSKSSLDAARAARDGSRAQISAQQAAIQTADANVAVLKAQKSEAERIVKELEVTLAKAKRDLSFTDIRAPFDGVIGNKSVQIGDYVTPGKRLAAVVPLDKVYIDANLKETQLVDIVPGETVSVRVDALNGASVQGVVESLAPASGSQFSLLPPENATGNFTKIVQRVPVRIAIPAAESNGKLRPGLSVIVKIDTRSRPANGSAKHASN